MSWIWQYKTHGMSQEQSIKSVVDAVVKRIDREINERVTPATCPLKREQRAWKIKQIKQQIAERIGDFGIKLTVDIGQE